MVFYGFGFLLMLSLLLWWWKWGDLVVLCTKSKLVSVTPSWLQVEIHLTWDFKKNKGNAKPSDLSLSSYLQMSPVVLVRENQSRLWPKERRKILIPKWESLIAAHLWCKEFRKERRERLKHIVPL